jgi:hypothetical protein
MLHVTMLVTCYVPTIILLYTLVDLPLSLGMEAVDVEVVSSAEHAHGPTCTASADSAPTLETEPSPHVKFGLEKHGKGSHL